MTKKRKLTTESYAEKAIKRFHKKYEIDPVTGCWIWGDSTKPDGYGRFHYKASGRRSVLAHRYAFEKLSGPIPEGLELDHLCRNKACVNPDHLEPVTHAVNVNRGSAATKLYCVNGHPLFGPNMRLDLKRGKRHCKTCNRIWWRKAGRKYRAKLKAEKEKARLAEHRRAA